MNHRVIPAPCLPAGRKAGIQWAKKLLDSRLRGNDIAFIFLLFCSLAFLSQNAFAAGAPLELQKTIEEKNKALQAVTNQIAEAQKNLINTEERSKTLKQELNRLSYQTNQLNLGIRSSELTIDKLELELSELQYDIASAETASELKKGAIEDLLRNVQRNDNESGLLVLLKNRTLSASMLEAQSITELNSTLASGVSALAELHAELTNKLSEKDEKKKRAESERQSLKIKQSSAVEQKNERQQLLALTKNQERLYQQTITELEKKQRDISDEIGAIEDELRSKIDSSLLPQKRPGVLELPVKNGFLSQNFGATAFAVKGGYRGKFHNGVDIAAPVGTPIVAAEDGKIVSMGDQDKYCRKGAYGRFIVVQHNNNLVTLYAHLSLIAQGITPGVEVRRGDLIGYIGKTGYATGPHLHLTVYSAPTFYIGPSRTCGPMPYGGYLNPLDYISAS